MKVTWHPERDGWGMVLEAERGEHGYAVLHNSMTLEETKERYGAENVTAYKESVPITCNVSESLRD